MAATARPGSGQFLTLAVAAATTARRQFGYRCFSSTESGCQRMYGFGAFAPGDDPGSFSSRYAVAWRVLRVNPPGSWMETQPRTSNASNARCKRRCPMMKRRTASRIYKKTMLPCVGRYRLRSSTSKARASGSNVFHAEQRVSWA